MDEKKVRALAVCEDLRECIRFRNPSTAARAMEAIAALRSADLGDDVRIKLADVEAGIKEWFSPRYWRRGNEAAVFRRDLFHDIASLENSIERGFVR